MIAHEQLTSKIKHERDYQITWNAIENIIITYSKDLPFHRLVALVAKQNDIGYRYLSTESNLISEKVVGISFTLILTVVLEEHIRISVIDPN